MKATFSRRRFEMIRTGKVVANRGDLRKRRRVFFFSFCFVLVLSVSASWVATRKSARIVIVGLFGKKSNYSLRFAVAEVWLVPTPRHRHHAHSASYAVEPTSR